MNIEALISKAAGDAVKALYGMDATEKMLQLQKRLPRKVLSRQHRR